MANDIKCNTDFSKYHSAVASEMIMMLLGMDYLPTKVYEHLSNALVVLDDSVGEGFSYRVTKDKNGNIDYEVEDIYSNG